MKDIILDEYKEKQVKFEIINEKLDNFIVQLAIACADLQKTDEIVKFYLSKADQGDRFGMLFAIRMQVQVLRSLLMIVMREDEDGIIPNLMLKAPKDISKGYYFLKSEWNKNDLMTRYITDVRHKTIAHYASEEVNASIVELGLCGTNTRSNS